MLFLSAVRLCSESGLMYCHFCLDDGSHIGRLTHKCIASEFVDLALNAVFVPGPTIDAWHQCLTVSRGVGSQREDSGGVRSVGVDFDIEVVLVEVVDESSGFATNPIYYLHQLLNHQ